MPRDVPDHWYPVNQLAVAKYRNKMTYWNSGGHYHSLSNVIEVFAEVFEDLPCCQRFRKKIKNMDAGYSDAGYSDAGLHAPDIQTPDIQSRRIFRRRIFRHAGYLWTRKYYEERNTHCPFGTRYLQVFFPFFRMIILV